MILTIRTLDLQESSIHPAAHRINEKYEIVWVNTCNVPDFVRKSLSVCPVGDQRRYADANRVQDRRHHTKSGRYSTAPVKPESRLLRGHCLRTAGEHLPEIHDRRSASQSPEIGGSVSIKR